MSQALRPSRTFMAARSRRARALENAAMAAVAQRAGELGLDARTLAFAAGFAHWHRGGYGTECPFHQGEAAFAMEWHRGFAAAHGRTPAAVGTYASHTHPND